MGCLMALRSSLFAGDARVEAIAVSDASNVKYGDHGPHVIKIQHALNLIEEAGLDEDGVYGGMTQQAVLDYNRARSIINYAYQTQADAIVGKMTIAALDDELWNQEQLEQTSGPMTVRLLLPIISPADEYREKLPGPRSPMLSFAISQAMLNAAGLPAPAAVIQLTGLNVASSATIDIVRGQKAVVEVKGGIGATITPLSNVVTVQDPVTGKVVSAISTDPQTISIVGSSPGSTFILLFKPRWPLQPENLYVPVVVRNSSTTAYIPTMQPHDHKPTRRWTELCGKIKQQKLSPAGILLSGLCAAKSPPETFVEYAKQYLSVAGGPVSMMHLNWFLHGHGADFVEDDNIDRWINVDSKLRDRVADFVRRNMGGKQPFSSSIWFGQSDYGSTEYAYAFGTIDTLCIEFDMNTRYVKIFFKDIYEWHPVCEPFYGTPKTGDAVRGDNSLHAAMVEMKDKGARDYWMIGEAIRPMSVFGL